MASRYLASIALLLSLNLVFFTMVSSTYSPPDSMENGGHSSNLPEVNTTCPRNTIKLGVCVDLLNGLANLQLGTPPKLPCCSLIDGLVDLEAAACLCTALKANVIGIKLDVSIALSILVNYCGREVPSGFLCA